MPGKPITAAGIEQDLAYIIRSTVASQFLENVFPPGVAYYRGKKILEPGCGSGKLGLRFWVMGADVTMLDIDPGVVAYAEALKARLSEVWKAPEELRAKLALEEGDVFTIGEKYGPVFDLVYNEGVPHHFTIKDPRRQESIRQMAAATKKGGITCVIGSNGHCEQMLEIARKTEHTYQGMPPKQTPFTKEELRRRLITAGLKETDVMPLGPSWEEALLLGGWGVKP